MRVPVVVCAGLNTFIPDMNLLTLSVKVAAGGSAGVVVATGTLVDGAAGVSMTVTGLLASRSCDGNNEDKNDMLENYKNKYNSYNMS